MFESIAAKLPEPPSMSSPMPRTLPEIMLESIVAVAPPVKSPSMSIPMVLSVKVLPAIVAEPPATEIAVFAPLIVFASPESVPPITEPVTS